MLKFILSISRSSETTRILLTSFLTQRRTIILWSNTHSTHITSRMLCQDDISLLFRAAVLTDIAVVVTHGYTNNILMYDVPYTGRTNVTNGVIRPQLYLVPVSFVHPTADLVITVTLLSGNVTAYLGNSSQSMINPNDPSTFLLFMSSSVRLERIVVPNRLLGSGPFFLLVVSQQNSTYAISQTYFTYHQLQMGLPQDAIISANKSHYYHITVNGAVDGASHDVIITATPTSGRVHLFVANSTNKLVHPIYYNASTYDFNSTDYFTAVQTLRIPNSACPLRRCTYVILVQALDYADVRYNVLAYAVNQSALHNATTYYNIHCRKSGYSPRNRRWTHSQRHRDMHSM